MRKTLLIITGIVLALITLLAAAPLLFKGKILAHVRVAVNRQLRAEADFKDLSLSIFRSFPHLSAGLDELVIMEAPGFAGDTLLSAKRIDLVLDIMKVFRGDYQLNAILLESPRIKAKVNRAGKANWDIMVPDNGQSSPADSEAMTIDIQRYAIKNGYLRYDDESMDLHAGISGLNHEGKARINQGDLQLNTTTRATSVDFVYENIPYLSGAVADIRSDLWIEAGKGIYRFQHTAIRLNELDVLTDGFFQVPNDSSYRMDIRFSSPSKDFRHLLSMIPAVYTKDFRDVQAGGSFSMNGWIKGQYGAGQFPGYELNLAVQKGFFQYPQLPEAVKDIALNLSLQNPDGQDDNLVVDLRQAHMVFGQDPVDMKLVFHHPVSRQSIDAMVKGKIDLQKMQRFFPMPPGTAVSGIVDADLFARGDMLGVETGDASFQAGGSLDIQQLAYQSPEMPAPIRNGRMQLSVRNADGVADQTNINLVGGHVEIGDDPVDFECFISKPLSDLFFEGNLTTDMDLANLAAYAKLEPGTTLTGELSAVLAFAGSRKAYEEKRYEDLKLEGNLGLRNLRYLSRAYPDAWAVTAARMTFSNLFMDLQECLLIHKGSRISANGRLQDFIGYALQKETLRGTLSLQADKVNLNAWMAGETASQETPSDSTVFRVPPRIDLQVNAGVDELVYDKVTYANLRGSMIVRNEQVVLKDVSAGALDGSITLNGTYDTRDGGRPPFFAMDYALKDMDVQKTFYAFNTVQKLMPVGQFISGRMHSSMKISGSLGHDMMPDLSTIEADGSLLLVQGVLKKFAPVEKLASALGVSGLEEISLRDIKNYIQVSRGRLLVKPFELSLNGIRAEIGGMQGIDQSMDYLVVMQVPRSMMGEQGNVLIGKLTEQAQVKGIPVSLGESIPLNARITGTILKPLISIDFKQTASGVADAFKAQANAFVEQKKDSLKQVASSAGNALRDSAKAIRDEAVAGYKAELIGKITGGQDSSAGNMSTTERLKTSAGESVKGVLNGVLKKKKSGS